MEFIPYFSTKNTLKIAVLIGILALFSVSFFSETFQEKNTYSYTKAICNHENICRDYEIVCQNNELVSMNYSGAIIQQPSNWQDARNEQAFCY
jgi:hypothetical protein